MRSLLTTTPMPQSITSHPLFVELVVSLAVLVLGALASTLFRSRLAQLYREIFRSRPTIKNFLREIRKKSYHGFPDDKKPSYYYRSGHPSQGNNEPTYHFFAKDGKDDNVHIERFMAFLIPSLDSGHGRQNREEYGQSGLEFNEDWGTYLRNIGEKANKLLEETRKAPPFRRIIFFDKELLLLFIENHREIYQAAQMEGKGFKEGSKTYPLARMARGVIQYAFDIAVVHRKIRIYRHAIESYYLAKSIVPSNKYYDFGLYCIEGIEIVYNPIYTKNSDKGIEEERVLIGTLRGQQRRINEYKEDFDNLWGIATTDKQEQIDDLQAKGEIYFRSPDYYKYDWLSVDFFAKGYYESLKKIFTEVFKIELP